MPPEKASPDDSQQIKSPKNLKSKKRRKHSMGKLVSAAKMRPIVAGQPNSKEQEPSESEHERLCARCANLNIAQLRTSSGTKVALGSVQHWSPKSCEFCRFLLDVVTLNYPPKDYESHEYYLLSVKTRRIPDRLFQMLGPRVLILSPLLDDQINVGTPYIVAQPDKPPSWLKLVQPAVDFDQAREWLDTCSRLHGDHCVDKRGNIIDRLRLIDCCTGKVVMAQPSDVYVALSYVWGNYEGSLQKDGQYPQTVQDAMLATRKLGFDRLWVDKYCIDQNDHRDLHDQLRQMDAIYQQATVTLVAAVGADARHGLAGVNTSLREPSLSVRVYDEHLSAVPRPELRPEDSKWITRAWTYQEGLLAKRRLVFTDKQMYFECQGYYCTEMLQIEDWTKLHHSENPWLHRRYRTAGRMGIFPLNGCGIDPWEIYSRITEYSERSLSYDADILNGILGIFRAFERQSNPIRHLYGIPFPVRALRSPNVSNFGTGSKLTVPTFSESLRWTLSQPSERRKGISRKGLANKDFPSWSWTGWYGKIEWPAEYTGAMIPVRTSRRLERPRDPKINEKAIKVEVEVKGGGRVKWEDFQTDYEALQRSGELTGILYVEAHTTPAVFSPIDGEHSHTAPSFYLVSQDGDPMPVTVSSTTTCEFEPQQSFLAVHFHCASTRNQGDGVTFNTVWHIMIVQDVGQHWERVALSSYTVDPRHKLVKTWECIRLG